jgi:hypothetical protein
MFNLKGPSFRDFTALNDMVSQFLFFLQITDWVVYGQ